MKKKKTLDHISFWCGVIGTPGAVLGLYQDFPKEFAYPVFGASALAFVYGLSRLLSSPTKEEINEDQDKTEDEVSKALISDQSESHYRQYWEQLEHRFVITLDNTGEKVHCKQYLKVKCLKATPIYFFKLAPKDGIENLTSTFGTIVPQEEKAGGGMSYQIISGKPYTPSTEEIKFEIECTFVDKYKQSREFNTYTKFYPGGKVIIELIFPPDRPAKGFEPSLDANGSSIDLRNVTYYTLKEANPVLSLEKEILVGQRITIEWDW